MGTPEEHLRQAVDEVLEPAWPKERRRAARRRLGATLLRVGVFLSAIWGLALVVFLITGAMLPWTFFAFMSALAFFAAQRESGDCKHLLDGLPDRRP